MKKRGQVSTEFIILLSMSLLFLFSMLSIVYSEMYHGNKDNERQMINDLGRSIQIEISIASESYTGYSRVFKLPNKLDNQINYNINNKETFINISTNNFNEGFHFSIPEVEGEIIKGENLIRNVDGKISLE